MRLPANIEITDKTHCSLKCHLMSKEFFGLCVARGPNPPRAELLKRDHAGKLLRTDYCRKMASDDWVHQELCPKCDGQCEGEVNSAYTYCLKCGTKFIRINDQDDNYLREDLR